MIAGMQRDLVEKIGEQMARVGDDELRGAAGRVMGLEYLVQCVDRSDDLDLCGRRAEFLGMSTIAVVGALRELGALDPVGGAS